LLGVCTATYSTITPAVILKFRERKALMDKAGKITGAPTKK
jgi:hypothetical protein